MSQTTGCKECKKRDGRPKQILLGLLGTYIIFSSIYGTIELIEKFLGLFK